MRGSYIQGMVSPGVSRWLDDGQYVLTGNVDAPADMIESDSQFVSGEKPIVKADSPVNK